LVRARLGVDGSGFRQLDALMGQCFDAAGGDAAHGRALGRALSKLIRLRGEPGEEEALAAAYSEAAAAALEAPLREAFERDEAPALRRAAARAAAEHLAAATCSAPRWRASRAPAPRRSSGPSSARFAWCRRRLCFCVTR
jgi:hypothetical protein